MRKCNATTKELILYKASKTETNPPTLQRIISTSDKDFTCLGVDDSEKRRNIDVLR
jgi:hypothetical protein